PLARARPPDRRAPLQRDPYGPAAHLAHPARPAAARAGGGGRDPEPSAAEWPRRRVPAHAGGGGVPCGPGGPRALGPALGRHPVRSGEPRPPAPAVERATAHRLPASAAPAGGGPLRLPRVPTALPGAPAHAGAPPAHPLL